MASVPVSAATHHASPPTTASAIPTRPPRGAVAAELLAVGAASWLLFPLSWLLRSHLGLDAAEYAVGFSMFYAAHLINDPHFAVTYLLFYGDARSHLRGNTVNRAQRARYLVAGVLVPMVLIGWSVLALVLRKAQLLGWMIQLMFLLVGWHYAKQGFGVLSVLSARRGVHYSPAERHVILAHCYAAWAFAWANPAHAAGNFVEKGVVYWVPSLPVWLDASCFVVFVASSAALAWTLLSRWRREGQLPLAPLVTFLVTIWLWTVYTRLDPLVRYAIPALHSLQYLYFVWLLSRNEARAQQGPPHFGTPVATRLSWLAAGAVALGYLLFRGAPALFDDALSATLGNDAAGTAFGATPLFAAVFVFVNIHHYAMDAVIWRRDNPRTRHLLDDTR